MMKPKLSRRLKTGFLAICGLAFLSSCTANAAFANTYYVDCNAGSDSNAGTSPGAPKLDLYASTGANGAAQAAVAGDTIIIKRGVTCNFPVTQTINKGVHITSSATYFENTIADPWPVLGSYGVWKSGWVSQGGNVWKHTAAWPGTQAPAHWVRFSALGIVNAGPSETTPANLVAAKQYYYYPGTSASDLPYVEVYAPSDPASYYGSIYYSSNSVLSFTSFGNGIAISSGMQVDFLTFSEVDEAIAMYPLDANFNGGSIQNIQCIDVHRCIFISGNSVSGTLSNFSLRANTITGSSGPAVHIAGLNRLTAVVVRNLTILTTGVSESYGGIYTNYVNANPAAVDTDFQIIKNSLSDCRSGNYFPGDGGCLENDVGSVAILMQNNSISASHACYQSNSGGISGTTPAAGRGLYFTSNFCNGTDVLAMTSDSKKQGKALVYITNNMLLNGSLYHYSPQIPNYRALLNSRNANAAGIYVQNNTIQLSAALTNVGYGIRNAMAIPSLMNVSGNTFLGPFISTYVQRQ